MSLILAHRGASAEFPENTLSAIEHALLDPPQADGFECDVRLSADDVPVVFHDDETTRLTGHPGSIEERPLSAIKALKVSGEAIPSFAELLEALDRLDVSPLTINIELKPTGDARALIDACRPMLTTLHQSVH